MTKYKITEILVNTNKPQLGTYKLMANLKQATETKTTAFALDNGEVISELRPYLGMSQLGHECSRYLWLSFHWAYTDSYSHRIKRLFARGHREEPEIIKELELIGIKCDPTQLESVAGEGHIRGHCDGTAIGVIEAPKTKHLLEFKTMSDKYFKQLVKSSSVKVSKFIYYVQCQLYMHHLKLKRTLFIAVNKNDDSYYVERLRYNKEEALEYLEKGHLILMCEEPPKAPFPPTYWMCRFCSAQAVCRGKEDMTKNCRTCTYVDIMPEGKWACTKHDIDDIFEHGQRQGCDSHNQIPC